MPYNTPDASRYISMKKTLIRNSVPLSINKFRAPLPYNNFYSPYLALKNIVGNGVQSSKFEQQYPSFDIDVDFDTADTGDSNSLFATVQIPYLTTRINFRYLNVPTDNDYNVEIDSEFFNFTSQDELLINGTSIETSIGEPYYSTYAIYNNGDIVVSGDIVTLITRNPYVGTIYPGIWIF